MLTTVYVNIPDCRWSTSYGCLPQDKSSKLLGTFLWCSPIYSKTHGPNCVYSQHGIRTKFCTCLWTDTNHLLGLHGLCWAAPVRWAALWISRRDRTAHCTPSPTLTSNHAMENSGTEGCRNIHTTKVSLRENPGIDKLGLGFSSSAIFYIISFCPVTTPQDQVARAATPAPHHNPHILIALLTIQACCISYCKMWSLLPLVFLSLPPSTQAKSILPPPDYHASFTYCCFSIPHTTSY